MFDTELPDLEALRGVDDNMLIAAITGWTQVEAAAAARRLAAVAELAHRRVEERPERDLWSCDYWDAAAAEVAAAQRISHGMAFNQMYLAAALRNRLPRVAALFADGMISARLVAAIAWHTNLIDDNDALRHVDAELAAVATGLGPLSMIKTADAINTLVDRHDPGALRRTRMTARSREIIIDAGHGDGGTSTLSGRLYTADATTLDRRLTQLADSVCDQDPRTLAQRRADALGALAAGGQTLACGCGSPDCVAAGVDARATNVVIHVVAEAATVDQLPDPHLSGEGPPSRPITPDMTLAAALADDPEPDPRPPCAPAVIVGGGIVPAPLLEQLIRGGAKVKPLWLPTDTAPEPGYRPSAALDAFIRCRDMTCRFPGCDRPAVYCDIDHAIAYPFGPTHPGNLRLFCRKHHLLKTFWTGPGGWSDRQLPDATIIFTAPSGHTYTTHPGSRLLFPALCTPTGPTPTPTTAPPDTAGRTLMMPTRKRTRTQNHTRRINAERALNDVHVAERNRPPPF